jgi:hypothetical protein
VSTSSSSIDSGRLATHYGRVVRSLVDSHAKRTDEPLVLAVRYRLDDPGDVYLFEVIENFPGTADDELFSTEFGPTADLVILGKLHLTLASPDQVRTAMHRHDPALDAIRGGEVLFPQGRRNDLAAELISALGLH